MSDSLWPHELQQARLPCPSPSPGLCSNSCPLSQWCHPTIPSPAAPFSSHPQSFPASGSLPMSQLFTSRGQNIGSSASASVLPVNIQGWFLLGLIDLMSLLSKGLSRVFSPAPQLESINLLALRLFYGPTVTSVHDYWKKIDLTMWTFHLSAVISLLFNMLSLFVIAFLPRSKCLLISWLQSPSAVILKSKKIKSIIASNYSPAIWHEMMGPDTMNLAYQMVSFKPTFSLSSFTIIGCSLVPLCFLP